MLGSLLDAVTPHQSIKVAFQPAFGAFQENAATAQMGVHSSSSHLWGLLGTALSRPSAIPNASPLCIDRDRTRRAGVLGLRGNGREQYLLV